MPLNAPWHLYRYGKGVGVRGGNAPRPTGNTTKTSGSTSLSKAAAYPAWFVHRVHALGHTRGCPRVHSHLITPRRSDGGSRHQSAARGVLARRSREMRGGQPAHMPSATRARRHEDRIRERGVAHSAWAESGSPAIARCRATRGNHAQRGSRTTACVALVPTMIAATQSCSPRGSKRIDPNLGGALHCAPPAKNRWKLSGFDDASRSTNDERSSARRCVRARLLGRARLPGCEHHMSGAETAGGVAARTLVARGVDTDRGSPLPGPHAAGRNEPGSSGPDICRLGARAAPKD